MQILELFLGILTAVGGFVEVGELLFCINAGSRFGYSLLWVVLLGTIGIIVYGEMAGRIVAVTRRPVFELIRDNTGPRLGLLTLIAATAVGWLTCAAEIGGVAIVLRLLLQLPYHLYLLLAFAFFVLVIWFVSFEWIERIFGLGGLLMLVFVCAAWALKPDLSQMAQGLLPHLPSLPSRTDYLDYAYYAVALFSSIMLPYETYFYASGGIEDGWKPKDVPMNRVIVVVGFSLGATLAAALLCLGAELFAAHSIQARLPGTAALAPLIAFGKSGLLLGLLGMLCAFSGATIENGLSLAYNIAQFFGWPWGKHRKPTQVPRFTATWIVAILLATALDMTGIDPVQVVEYSIIFAVVILPLSYLPILRTAHDSHIMGTHANGRLANWLGAFYLLIVSVAALAAIPLLVLTHSGDA